MTDDFFDPKNPNQDCHSFGLKKPEDKLPEGYFDGPPNSANFWHRLPEIITDPSCNQLSASRFGLILMNLAGVVAAVYLALTGGGQYALGIICGVATTDAGIYFASTIKDRWQRLNREENQ